MTSLYIEAIIEENYRDFFNKLYYGERCELCIECLKGVHDCTSLKSLKANTKCEKCEEAFKFRKKTGRKFENFSHANYWHSPKCIFKKNTIRSSANSYYYDKKYNNLMGYDKKVGKLLIIAYINNYGNKSEYFIQNCILPFGEIIKYKSYDSKTGIDNIHAMYHSKSKYKSIYTKKYQYILDKLDSKTDFS